MHLPNLPNGPFPIVHRPRHTRGKDTGATAHSEGNCLRGKPPQLEGKRYQDYHPPGNYPPDNNPPDFYPPRTVTPLRLLPPGTIIPETIYPQ